MLDLLFLNVFTMWNTSMIFCCWIISHTLQMAQKVPLRPPPFLGAEEKRQQMKPGKGRKQYLHSSTYAERGLYSAAWLRKFLGLWKSSSAGAAWELAALCHEGRAKPIPGSGREEALGAAMLLFTPLGLRGQSWSQQKIAEPFWLLHHNQ